MNSKKMNPQIVRGIIPAMTALFLLTLTTCTLEDDAMKELRDKAKATQVTEVSLDRTTLNMFIGDSQTLVATVLPADAWKKDVSWESSDTDTVTVDKNGRVTALAAGEATVTVTTTDGGKTASCAVMVGHRDAAAPVINYAASSLANKSDYTIGAAPVPLTVELSNADAMVSLSYRWFEAAASIGAGTVISGQTAKTYTPPTNTAYEKWFRVEITNTDNTATGDKTATETSVRVHIKVNPAGLTHAVDPVIHYSVSSLADKTDYIVGGTPAALSVELSNAASMASLSYRWFEAATSTGAGTAISGQTAKTYTPPTSTAYEKWYWVEITNTNNAATGNKTAVTASNRIHIKVNALTHAAAPVIDYGASSLADKTDYIMGGTPAALTVELSNAASMVSLSYRWFEAATSTGTGTAISGQTAKTYTPPTNTAYEKWFRVEITNTDNAATGNKTAVTASNRIHIKVVPPAPANLRIISQPFGSVTLAWDPVSGASGYNVYRSIDTWNGPHTKINSNAVTGTSYPNSGLTENTSYYYKVSSIVNGVEGMQSGNIAIYNNRWEVWISAGTFEMGSSPEREPERNSDETRHKVTLSPGFYMSRHQVTQAEYEAVMKKNPSHYQWTTWPEPSPNSPVEMVSWYDAIVFCNWKSLQDGLEPAYHIGGNVNPDLWGPVPTSDNAAWNAVEIRPEPKVKGWRLPTEAQWEYACRAGTDTAYNTGEIFNYSNTPVTGWCRDNSGIRTLEVGKLPANAWGLYDMHGNVWEWCWDRYGAYSGDEENPTGASSGSERVRRGGSFWESAGSLRSANRGRSIPSHFNNNIGLRLVRLP